MVENEKNESLTVLYFYVDNIFIIIHYQVTNLITSENELGYCTEEQCQTISVCFMYLFVIFRYSWCFSFTILRGISLKVE